MAGAGGGRLFSHIGAVIFMVVALMHALRVAFQVHVTMGTVVVPMWVSIPGAIVAATLSVLVWREARRP